MSGRFADQWGRVAAVLGPWLAGPVEHIGSTSIPGLAAKPVVDMLGPVRSLEVAGELVGALGTPVVAIARLVAAHVDTVRDVIHAFNDKGLAALDSQWAGDRPRLMSRDDEDYVAATATTRPETLGRPFTHWSLRKLVDHLADNPVRTLKIGRESVRLLLHERKISFQRTRTWKESTDPDKEAKLDRIEHVTSHFLNRCFAFDQFGPLSIRPCHGLCWASEEHPDRLPATYHRTHGIRYFHGCYSLADDQLWGINREHKGGANTLAALKTIRQARPDGAPIYVIMDNLSANKTPPIRAWAHRHNVELCFTPTSASWANPISVNRLSGGRLAWAV